VSAPFFGQFLLERGAITGEQLLAAVAIQETTNVLLGTRAIDAGLMTAGQVEEINALQRSVDRRFGELAVERGYMREEQLKGLLSRQKEARLMLGEALLKIGALDNARLADQLAAFKRESQRVPGTVAEIYDGLANAEVLEIVTDVTAKMFQRILHTLVRPGSCFGADFKLAPAAYTIHQRIKGDVKALVGLDVSAAMIKLIGGKLLGMEVATIDADTLDGAAEFVNVVCGNVCARLSSAGRKVDLDPPAVHVWSGGVFDFAGAQPGGRLTATPLLHPDETIELVVVV
jgi:CheY-specific phosphatase CheX